MRRNRHYRSSNGETHLRNGRKGKSKVLRRRNNPNEETGDDQSQDYMSAEVAAVQQRSNRALESAHRIARHWTGADEVRHGSNGPRTFSRMSASSKYSQRSGTRDSSTRRHAPKVDIVPWYQGDRQGGRRTERGAYFSDNLPQYSPIVSAASSTSRWGSSSSGKVSSRYRKHSSRLEKHEEELMGDIAELDKRLQRLGRK